jgi:signal transduction histidine kinase
VVTTSGLPDQWREWWLSAFCGALLVVPLALAWYPWPRVDLRRRPSLGAILPLAAVVASSALVFQGSRPWAYLVFPALLWSGLRLGQRGATVAVAVASGFAVWATVHLLGPFHFYNANSSVLETNLFIVVAAVSTASFTALVTDRERLARALRATLGRVVDTAEHERQRIERDLHDGAQQRLMVMQVRLRLAQERVQDPAVADELQTIRDDAATAVEDLRALGHGIYPSVLRDCGVVDALRSLAMGAARSVGVVDERIGRCPGAIETAIYFCSVEAIQNATKHAGSDAHVTVTLGRDRGSVRFAIVDDGVGMDLAPAADGLGFVSMRDRIEAVGGRLDFISSPGHGMTVRGTVPVEDRPDPSSGRVDPRWPSELDNQADEARLPA